MAGRELPASVRAFRDHLIRAMAPPRSTRLAQHGERRGLERRRQGAKTEPRAIIRPIQSPR
jgi:hypothetical protein